MKYQRTFISVMISFYCLFQYSGCILLENMTILNVTPNATTIKIDTAFTFTMNGSVTFNSSLLELRNESTTMFPCIPFNNNKLNISNEDPKCSITFIKQGLYEIFYNDIYQHISINATEPVLECFSVEPNLTFYNENETNQSYQSFILNFNRVPKNITFHIASQTEENITCENLGNIEYRKKCTVNINAITQDTIGIFSFENNSTNIDIKKNNLTLNFIEPTRLNESFDLQTISFTFNSSPLNYTENIFIGNSKGECTNGISENNQTICKFLLIDSGTIPIYLGGLYTGKTIKITKQNLHSNYLSLNNLVLLIGLFLIY